MRALKPPLNVWAERRQGVPVPLFGKGGCDQVVDVCGREDQSVAVATVRDLTPNRLLTEPIWQTVEGERRSILSS